ncbi:MAG TPA: hypothetical protein VEB42_16470, partial [Chitinophagaceae bacterium]|nr:hypothetical protein [Chitinophagaceae bacterium]
VLLNPEMVRFRFDKSQMLLKAWAKRPLLVENKMLGFIIHVDLDSFSYSFLNSIFIYKQSRYFEPVKGITEEQQRTYAANRLKAYAGSEMHFMRAVYKNALAREGFRLYKYIGKENAEKKRIRQQVLQAELDQAKIGPIDFSVRGKDTLQYYKTVMAEPSFYFSDSVRVNVEDRRMTDTAGMVRLNLNRDTFLLEYDPSANQDVSSRQLKRWASLKDPGQYEDEVYNFLQRPKYENRYSLLTLTSGDALYIRDNGKVENSTLLTQGLLAVRRMAYDLPWDYEPIKDYEQLADEKNVAGVEDRIAGELEKISQQHASSELYLHLDKTVYDHDENIWFAAYVLRSAVDFNAHKTLYVFLKNKAGRQVIASQQFVMNSGYGAGYLFLADSIPGGDYKLVAYTNAYPKEANPVVFEQNITLRPYAANFGVTYAESRNTFSGDSVYMNFQVKNDKGLYASNANVTYQLILDGSNIASGRKKVNDYGELIIGLPLRQILGKKLTLETNVKLNSAAASLKTPVLVQANYARLKYYPEGGDLVDGLPCRLMLEIKDLDHKPLPVSGKLLENGQPIGTFKTDNSGVADIRFTPHATSVYSIQSQDSIMFFENEFPQILREGYVIKVQQAAVKDSVKIKIFTNKRNADAYILLHNYKTNYFLGALHFKGQQGTVTLSTAEMPAGLATITIFNEKGMPVAERCIYKEPASQPNLEITIDSTAYGNRSKLTARITSTDAEGKPIPAVVSLACVLARRIDVSRFQDITSFNYLNAYNGAGLLPGKPNLLPAGNYLEQFLLVQGWTRYAWQQMSAETNKDNQRFTFVQKGKVLYDGRIIRKPVEVLAYKSDSFITVKTDSKGYFEVPVEMMTTEADWKINFAVNDMNKQEYTIVFENDNDELQKMLAATETPDAVRTIFPPEEKPERGVLAPVIVKANTNANFQGNPFGPAGCQDWVCMNNYLNCPNHPHGTKPQRGGLYKTFVSGGYVLAIYTGCTTDKPNTPDMVFQLKGRYYTKQFYVADYEKFNPDFPEKFTTLYWNPFITLDEKGEAAITFYTNDVNGPMMLMAQGVTDAGPVSARKE